ncbi:hypothetical protein ACFQZ4_51405 [Catellatospora coxensis]
MIRTRPERRGGRTHPMALGRRAPVTSQGRGTVMGKALTAGQFEAYARRQITVALDILDRHHEDLIGLCACSADLDH